MILFRHHPGHNCGGEARDTLPSLQPLVGQHLEEMKNVGYLVAFPPPSKFTFKMVLQNVAYIHADQIRALPQIMLSY